jgi:RNA polymerase sigma factor (sigma-70 family)
MVREKYIKMILNIKSPNRHCEKLPSYCRILTKGDRELCNDVLQGSYLKAMYALRYKNYVFKGNFRAWMYRIVFSVFITECRHNQFVKITTNTISDEIMIPDYVTPETIYLKKEKSRTLDYLIASLGSVKSKEVFRLSLKEYCSYGSIAEQLEISPGNVRVTISRGVKKMREQVLRSA